MALTSAALFVATASACHLRPASQSPLLSRRLSLRLGGVAGCGAACSGTAFAELLVPAAAAAPGDMLRVQGFDPSAVPRIGRFEALTGARAFIGSWQLLSSNDGPSGVLLFLKNGDVELRLEDGSLVGTGAQPWTYVSPKAPETEVRLSFTLDCGEQRGVLSFDGTLDSAGGPTRVLSGGFEGGDVRSGGKLVGLKQTGTFTASLRRGG